MSLTAHELLQQIRSKGGDVRLGLDGGLQCRKVPSILKKRLERNHSRILAWLKEEQASKAWEASGRDPNWWRTP